MRQLRSRMHLVWKRSLRRSRSNRCVWSVSRPESWCTTPELRDRCGEAIRRLRLGSGLTHRHPQLIPPVDVFITSFGMIVALLGSKCTESWAPVGESGHDERKRIRREGQQLDVGHRHTPGRASRVSKHAGGSGAFTCAERPAVTRDGEVSAQHAVCGDSTGIGDG
jgi:hypothetical protein